MIMEEQNLNGLEREGFSKEVKVKQKSEGWVRVSQVKKVRN